MILRTKVHLNNENMEILPEDENGLSYVCMYADLANDFKKNVPWHWHSFFEIDYIAEGSLELYLPEKTLHLEKGDVIFINSGILHSYKCKTKDKCMLYAHLFDGNYLIGRWNQKLERKYLYPVLGNAGLDVIKIDGKDTIGKKSIEKIIKMVDLMHEESFGYELLVHSLLCEFWCQLLEQEKESLPVSPGKKDVDIERMKIMLSFIQKNYMEKISLEDIAKTANISARECSRCFQKNIKTTPISYLNQFRIQVAIEQLIQTNEPVVTISENCGFSSKSYFGKVFKDTLGCTPKEYRKKCIHFK